MVLAQRLDGDVAGEDELVVPLVVRERGQRELPWGEQFGVGGDNASRGVDEMLRARIVAEGSE
jgi:hypothetical protein